jgi:ABC-type hemin transport system ATPase subunit
MIEAHGLVKHYRSTLAVDNLSFDVRPGTVTGFLGPNGAGKPVTGLRHSSNGPRTYAIGGRLDTCLISRELLREQMSAARCRYCTALSKARHGF